MSPGARPCWATKPILSLCGEKGSRKVCQEDLDQISEEVRSAAYRIIEAKHATYYGIGMAMTRITKAILGDEHSVLTVSAMLKGEYGQSGVFAGVPCIINKKWNPERPHPVPDGRGVRPPGRLLRDAAGELPGHSVKRADRSL